MVLEKMAMSDIVVDQVYCDTPMAGFATEAAINGVPVVVGGYYADVYKRFCLIQLLRLYIAIRKN